MSASSAETRTVAVVGASQDRRKFGNKCVRAYQHAGWTVQPVNPNAERVEGLDAVASLAELPVLPDRVCLYLPPQLTARLLDRLPRGPEIFFNPGSATPETLAEARRLGLDVHDACSIVAIGLSPSQFT